MVISKFSFRLLCSSGDERVYVSDEEESFLEATELVLYVRLGQE